MSYAGAFRAAVLAAVLPAAHLAAQSSSSHSVRLSARGGGENALANLNSAGTLDTKLGYSAGTAVTIQVHRYVALRGDFTFARDELRSQGVDAGTHFNKLFYTGAVQLQYPTRSGLMPYALVGAGGVTVHEQGTDGQDKTKVAGVGGLGLSYTIARSRWAVFTEGLGYLHNVSGFRGSLAGLDRNQFDVAWSAGLSYAIPF